jgi:hypothetical protein
LPRNEFPPVVTSTVFKIYFTVIKQAFEAGLTVPGEIESFKYGKFVHIDDPQNDKV